MKLKKFGKSFLRWKDLNSELNGPSNHDAMYCMVDITNRSCRSLHHVCTVNVIVLTNTLSESDILDFQDGKNTISVLSHGPGGPWHTSFFDCPHNLCTHAGKHEIALPHSLGCGTFIIRMVSGGQKLSAIQVRL